MHASLHNNNRNILYPSKNKPSHMTGYRRNRESFNLAVIYDGMGLDYFTISIESGPENQCDLRLKTINAALDIFCAAKQFFVVLMEACE